MKGTTRSRKGKFLYLKESPTHDTRGLIIAAYALFVMVLLATS
jgi:hypothetical protein